MLAYMALATAWPQASSLEMLACMCSANTRSLMTSTKCQSERRIYIYIYVCVCVCVCRVAQCTFFGWATQLCDLAVTMPNLFCHKRLPAATCHIEGTCRGNRLATSHCPCQDALFTEFCAIVWSLRAQDSKNVIHPMHEDSRQVAVRSQTMRKPP